MTSRAFFLLVAITGIALGSLACRRSDVYAVTAGAVLDAGNVDSPSQVGWALYVSPNGDDNNPGTLAQPLRTLARARDVVRGKNSAMTADIAVYLRGGTYPQSSTLAFTNADSGSGGYYVKYLAYPGERPLITGGQPIVGWKLADAANGIYSANAGATSFRQLYVNGVKAVRARSPNLGPNREPNFYRLSGYDTNAHNLQTPSANIASWKNLTKVEMHLMTDWADNTLRLSSYTTSGATAYIKIQNPEDSILFVRPNPRLDQTGSGPERAFYFENAYEMLDQPGEWYLDETTNTVYYKMRAGDDMATATVIAPMVETIMSIQGAGTSDGVGYLWFQGLTFAHSTYLRPSRYGFLDTQVGQYNLTATADNKQTVGRPAGGVTVSNAHHVHFERNMFAQMAATGLDFVSGTHDDWIIGNVFTQIGGNGVSVGKFTADDTTEYHIPYNPTDKNEICTNDTIANNYINDVTDEFPGASGIACGYPRNIVIEHNDVSVMNFTGISIGYGWTTSPNAMTNNVINYNNVHHILDTLGGGAAILTLSNQGRASEIQYNYLHDFSQSRWADSAVWGIFLDEGTAGYTVAHNLLVNAAGLMISSSAGANLVTDNSASPAGASTTLASAGIEPSYIDIKDLSIPIATF